MFVAEVHGSNPATVLIIPAVVMTVKILRTVCFTVDVSPHLPNLNITRKLLNWNYTYQSLSPTGRLMPWVILENETHAGLLKSYLLKQNKIETIRTHLHVL